MCIITTELIVITSLSLKHTITNHVKLTFSLEQRQSAVLSRWVIQLLLRRQNNTTRLQLNYVSCGSKKTVIN